MHNAIAHHLLTDAQAVPKYWPPDSFGPSSCSGHDITWYGVPLWPVCVSYLSCVYSQLLVPPAFLTGEVRS